MFDCLILGDSIGVGVSMFRKECAAYVQSGINSQNYVTKFNNKVRGIQTETAIISLGANDPPTLFTEYFLTTLRSSVNADHVYWIVPNNQRIAREDVLRVARRFNDAIIDTRVHELSRDKIHPTARGYRAIANETQGDTE